MLTFALSRFPSHETISGSYAHLQQQYFLGIVGIPPTRLILRAPSTARPPLLPPLPITITSINILISLNRSHHSVLSPHKCSSLYRERVTRRMGRLNGVPPRESLLTPLKMRMPTTHQRFMLLRRCILIIRTRKGLPRPSLIRHASGGV